MNPTPLTTGTLLRYPSPDGDRIERILLLNQPQQSAIVYVFWANQPSSTTSTETDSGKESHEAIDLPSIPFARSVEAIETAIKEGDCVIEPNDIWSRGIEPRNEDEERVRDRLWAAIQPIVADGISHLTEAQIGRAHV